MTDINYTNIDFPEAQMIAEDIRLYVRTDPLF